MDLWERGGEVPLRHPTWSNCSNVGFSFILGWFWSSYKIVSRFYATRLRRSMKNGISYTIKFRSIKEKTPSHIFTNEKGFPPGDSILTQIMTTKEVSEYLKLHEITICKYTVQGKKGLKNQRAFHLYLQSSINSDIVQPTTLASYRKFRYINRNATFTQKSGFI